MRDGTAFTKLMEQVQSRTHPAGESLLIRMDCTICMAMFGNGVGTCTHLITTRTLRRKIRLVCQDSRVRESERGITQQLERYWFAGERLPFRRAHQDSPQPPKQNARFPNRLRRQSGRRTSLTMIRPERSVPDSTVIELCLKANCSAVSLI